MDTPPTPPDSGSHAWGTAVRGTLAVACLALAATSSFSCKSESSAETDSPRSAAARDLAERYRESWLAFQDGAEDWPVHRRDWLEAGSEERAYLLQLLLYEILHSQQTVEQMGTEQPAWFRAQRELRFFGSSGERAAVEALRMLSSRKPVDWVAVDRVGGALVELRAREATEGLLEDPNNTPEQRLAAVRVLAAMQTEGRAMQRLLAVLSADPDWQLRGKAVEGLSRFARQPTDSPDHSAVRRGLIEALADSDEFVARKVFTALADDRGAETRALLVNRYEEAVERQDVTAEAVLYRLLEANTGVLGVAHNADAWRRAIEHMR